MNACLDAVGTSLERAYFNGVIFVEDNRLTVSRFERVRRSWWQRLFTRPWSPARAFDVVEIVEPDPTFYRVGNYIYAHPATLEKFKSRLTELG